MSNSPLLTSQQRRASGSGQSGRRAEVSGDSVRPRRLSSARVAPILASAPAAMALDSHLARLLRPVQPTCLSFSPARFSAILVQAQGVLRDAAVGQPADAATLEQAAGLLDREQSLRSLMMMYRHALLQA